jgi:purine nucleosidase
MGHPSGRQYGSRRTVKVHLDTDLGGDPDDVCALALVLNWPGAELLGVTTVLDDQGQRAGYVRYVLGLAGRNHVPVAAGADKTLGCFRIDPRLPVLPEHSVYWPEPIPPVPTPLDHALCLLRRSIEQDAIIVSIGGLTNLALLEQRFPGILPHAKLYVMGGFVFPPREGFPQWTARDDWNMQVDARSAKYVIDRSTPTFIPAAVTAETALRRAHLPILRDAGVLGQLIARQGEAYALEQDHEAKYGRTCARVPDDILNFHHDPLACAVALGWREGVEISELSLASEVIDGWLCQRPDSDGWPARIVTRVDGEQFSTLWLKVVAGRPTSSG